ncbi:MAG: hypothetical protein ABI806_18135 [Candidatus Solibacter sp.]
MRKITAISMLSLVSLMLSGCTGDEEAREYAKGLLAILRTYQTELESKMAAEQKAYRALVKVYSGAADADLLASLSTDRKERGDRLSELAITGKTPGGVALRDALKDYANREADDTHELLTRESDNYDKYLSSLNKLAVDADAVEQAETAVEALTRKPSLIGELKFLKEYGTAAKSCLDELTCKSLADEMKAAKSSQTDTAKVLKAAADEAARQARLSLAIKGIEARQKQAGCANNPTCPKK